MFNPQQIQYLVNRYSGAFRQNLITLAPSILGHIKALLESNLADKSNHYVLSKISTNNWDNQDFYNFISVLSCAIESEFRTKNINTYNIQQSGNIIPGIISVCINATVSFTVAYDMVSNTNNLRSTLDPNTMYQKLQDCKQIVGGIIAVCQSIGVNIPYPLGFNEQYQTQQYNQPPNNYAGYYTQQPQQQYNTTTANLSQSDAYIPKYTPNQQPGFPAQPPHQPPTLVVGDQQTVNIHNWVSSLEQIYYPLHNPDTHVLSPLKTPEGNIKILIDTKGAEMKREDHVIPGTNISMDPTKEIRKANEFLISSSAQSQVEQRQIPDIISHMYLNGLIMKGLSIKLGSDDKRKNAYFISNNKLLRPVVACKSLFDIYYHLSNNNLNLATVHKALANINQSFPYIEKDRSLITAVKWIDNYLTAILNDFIEYNLSYINKQRVRLVGSFLEDYEDLVKLFQGQKEIGLKRLESLYSWEQEGISRKLFIPTSVEMNDRCKKTITTSEDCYVTTLQEQIFIAYSNLTINEIESAVPFRSASCISIDRDPILYKIAHSLLNHKYEVTNFVSGYYIVLADESVLRIFKGYMDKNVPLIKQVS